MFRTMRLLAWIFSVTVVLAAPAMMAAHAAPAGPENILEGIEKRYAGKAFKASFFQESILKTMQITDTAEGYLIVRPPGRMRWEYTIPDPQSIVTDGETMWIHRPSDKQVMVGRAPEFFGGGKGAGFLSDIGRLRKSFRIESQPAENERYYRLKLVPFKSAPELTDIVISVNKNTFLIDQVVTHNAYGDETRIVLNDYQFGIQAEEGLFNFKIPEGVDVIQMEQF